MGRPAVAMIGTIVKPSIGLSPAEAWESAARGESPADALVTSSALRRATETFGPVRA